MTAALPRSSPTAQGVAPAGIVAFLDALDAAPDIELHSLMVLRHGRVVAEGWWAPYTAQRPHLLYSLSKSFTATAAGFAVAEGLLDLDAPVISYFPELDAEVTDPRSRAMRVRHVAAMASGHLSETLDRAVALDPDEPVRGFLLTPPERDPGTVFAYNQPCTYTLAAIIQRRSGLSLTDYLRPRLFEPLGIGTHGWRQQPPGRDIGYSGLHATTDAVARLGLLHLRGGVWDGRRLLPADWVAQATRRQVANPDQPNPDWRQGYGFQFWMARHGYRGDGAFGQFCVVLPEHDVVIATTADTPDMQGVLDAVWTHLLPAFGGKAAASGAAASGAAASGAAGDRAAEEDLARRLANAALPAVTADPEPADPSRWAGRTFVPAADRGPDDPVLDTVTLDRTGDGWTLRLDEAAGSIGGPVGAGAWRTSTGPGVPVAVSGGWVAPDRFRADVIFLETPHRLRVECVGETATARWRTAPLHGGSLAGLRMPTAPTPAAAADVTG